MASETTSIINRAGPHGETVGANVHFVCSAALDGAKAGRLIPAVVTQVNDTGTVALKLLYPMGIIDSSAVPYSEAYKPGCWSWPQKAVTGPIVIHATELQGTGTVQETTPGILALLGAVRLDAGQAPRAGAEIAFTYRGPSRDTIPLGNGEVRRQIGLRLRAANTCNVIYVMWHIEPTTGIRVSIKSNPGMTSHEQCGDRGYINVTPVTEKPVAPIRVGEKRTLSARIESGVLQVTVDGVAVWTGSLPPEAFAFDGPIGIRSDNGEFDCELRALQ